MASDDLSGVAHKSKLTPISGLTPHPKNYRKHPPEQLDHLAQSIREHGFYRSVVVARDGTILAGHGIVEAAGLVGLKQVPATFLDLDPDEPQALKVLAGDNELTRLAVNDDAGLSDLLQRIASEDASGLLGTGFDHPMLADLIFSASPERDGERLDPDAHWLGMPDYENERISSHFRLTVHFKTEEDVESFFKLIEREKRTMLWWPESDGHVGSDFRSHFVSEEASE